uniref:Uncharacterized protein n=1 Tax=Romanomermis culicivorax TaxID=13658 RepID=A0A915IB27_ROMCU
MGPLHSNYSNNPSWRQPQSAPTPPIPPQTPAPAPQSNNDAILTNNALLGQLIDLLQKTNIAPQPTPTPPAALQPSGIARARLYCGYHCMLGHSTEQCVKLQETQWKILKTTFPPLAQQIGLRDSFANSHQRKACSSRGTTRRDP